MSHGHASLRKSRWYTGVIIGYVNRVCPAPMRAVGNASSGPGMDAVRQGSRADGNGGGIDRDGVESFPPAFVGPFGGWGLTIGG